MDRYSEARERRTANPSFRTWERRLIRFLLGGEGEQRHPGGGFFGEFFRGAAALAERAVEEENLHVITARVVFAFGGNHFVADGVVAVDGLHEFLETAFGVVGFFGRGEARG